jgi:tRNA(His) 5'-end guanylyltransferase
MKEYEGAEAGRRLMPLLPALARLDGKGFSNFTRPLERPYDRRLTDLMIATTTYLVRETNANIGYCQSDEISLTWLSADFDTQIFFDGKIQKMVSVLASMATAYFNASLPDFFPTCKEIWKGGCSALFDCRVWNVPNVVEGANTFLWREKDATKNSISMAARHYYSHQALENKSSAEMQEMLWQRGVNWNDYPATFKRGTFIQRRKTVRRFSAEELAVLPPKHQARQNPDLEIERTDYVCLDMPPFTKVTNRPEVIYLGAEPIVLGTEGP